MKVCPKCRKSFEDAVSFCPHDGEVLEAAQPDLVGQVIDGKYRVESFIAQGGMGSLYRAWHIPLDDQVVIKTLRSEMRHNAEWLKRFQREGKAARKFRHPNAVTVYDLSTASDGLIYMVMEYVEGHTLDKELKRRERLAPAEALDILEPVADVLDAAHARGVIHRDMKPENVMLGTDEQGRGFVKVLDLGIAKMVGVVDAAGGAEAGSLTVAGQILGTPYYMSPEQWGELPRDGNPEIDGRTDIYSLGVIFYELIAGRKPHSGPTLQDIRRGHITGELPRLDEVVAGVPEEFGRAVERAMAKDRDDRYPTATEFTDDLRLALGLQPKARASTARVAGDGGGVAREPVREKTGESHAAVGEDAVGEDAGAAPSDHASPPAQGGHAATILTSDQTASVDTGLGDGRETSAQPFIPGTRAGGDAARSGRAARGAVGADTAEAHDAPPTEAAGAAAEPVVRPPLPEPEPPARRPYGFMIAGGALAALLLVVGVLFVVNRSRGTAGGDANAGVTRRASPSPPAPSRVEAVSYWLEVFKGPKNSAGERVADPAAMLSSGQEFKLHFRTPWRGYLYIIGHGEKGNALTTFLTAQGADMLKSNQVTADADFPFPFGKDSILYLDDNPGTDVFTVVFSATPLLAPSFLTGRPRYALNPAQVKELEDFRTQHAANEPALSVRGDGAERVVSVTVPDSTAKTEPLVFDIRIIHR